MTHTSNKNLCHGRKPTFGDPEQIRTLGLYDRFGGIPHYYSETIMKCLRCEGKILLNYETWCTDCGLLKRDGNHHEDHRECNPDNYDKFIDTGYTISCNNCNTLYLIEYNKILADEGEVLISIVS